MSFEREKQSVDWQSTCSVRNPTVDTGTEDGRVKENDKTPTTASYSKLHDF